MFVHCVCCVLCAVCVCVRACVHRHICYWALSVVLVQSGFGQMCLCVCVLCVVCSTKCSDADQHALVYVRAHTCALTRISMRAADIFTGTHSKILPTGEPGDLKIYVANCGDCRAVCVRGWGAGGCESERGSEGKMCNTSASHVNVLVL